MAAPSFNFADLLSVVADEVPARTALICGERRLSYRELDTRATALARYLHAIGVRRGHHVGIQLRNAIEYVETFSLRAGSALRR